MSWENFIQENESLIERKIKLLNDFSDNPWFCWLANRKELNLDYDLVLEIVVEKFELRSKTRLAEVIDKRHCFCLFWYELHIKGNILNKYKTKHSLAKLLHQDHATILHLLGKRKKTLKYEENTKELSDYIKQITIEKW